MSIEVSDIALNPNLILHDKYQIQEVYYLGQTAIVYFGRDLLTNNEVVIKEFMPHALANRDMDGKTIICKSKKYLNMWEKSRDAFAFECEQVYTLRTLKKPYEGCVLKYLDDFDENGTKYLITEKINGKSLQDYIESGEKFSIRQTMQEVVDIVAQIHKNNIVHCDIKPSNIILREDGKAVLIDFGSSVKKDCLQREITFVSRGYSAPELYHGEKIDKKTDIYSIGAILYHLLTDYQLPEPDDYDEQEEIPPLSQFVEISQFLEKVILASIQRDRKKRLNSLALMQAVLKI